MDSPTSSVLRDQLLYSTLRNALILFAIGIGLLVFTQNVKVIGRIILILVLLLLVLSLWEFFHPQIRLMVYATITTVAVLIILVAWLILESFRS